MHLQPQQPRSPTIASENDLSSPVLYARQATTTIITSAPPPADCAGQYSGGALAGAVLGTFFGTILLIYLFSSLKNGIFGQFVGNEEVVVEKRRKHKSSASHSSVRRPSAVYSGRG